VVSDVDRDGVLILGGTGAVGRALGAELARTGVPVTAASRHGSANPSAGERARRLDVRDRGALAEAVRGMRVVVDATGLDDAGVVAASVGQAADLVDLSADAAHAEALRGWSDAAAAAGVTVLPGVGLAPGLSNLLAVAAHGRGPGDRAIALDLVLGLGEHHGPAATRWMLGQLAGRPRHDRRRADLPAGFGRRTLRWADFAEQHVLSRELGVPVVSRAALDPALLGVLATAAARAPGAGRLLPASAGLVPLLTRRAWWLVAAQLEDGTSAWATGRGQSEATAVVVAWAVRELLAGRLPAGTHDLHHVTDLDAVTPWLQQHGIATATHAAAAC
jgi:hypothetical protein